MLRTNRAAPSPTSPSRREGPPSSKAPREALRDAPRARVWLFDLDNTLHDANRATFPALHVSFGDYIEEHLGLAGEEAQALRQRYWHRYGATLLGLVRHHGVRAAHFLEQTHRLPELESLLAGDRRDLRALRRLPGRKYIVTNGPRAYAERVLRGLGASRLFDGVFGIEDMAMFGSLRPKPDRRSLRMLARRLGVAPSRCVLVEDTLANLKSARRLGMRTVWMCRWLEPSRPGRHARPPYVCARIRALRMLARHR